jgi:hypothetical protein
MAVYRGTEQLTQILDNNITIGTPMVSLFGPSYFQSDIIEGNYTALLFANVGFDMSLSEVGTVPASSRSSSSRLKPTNRPVSESHSVAYPFPPSPYSSRVTTPFTVPALRISRLKSKS